MSWYVYIVLTERNTLYTGVALDPDARFRQHVEGSGAKYLRAFRPVRIVWREEHPDQGSALRRERAIKKLSRRQKDLLVAGGTLR